MTLMAPLASLDSLAPLASLDSLASLAGKAGKALIVVLVLAVFGGCSGPAKQGPADAAPTDALLTDCALDAGPGADGSKDGGDQLDGHVPDGGDASSPAHRLFGVTLTDPWALEGSSADHVLERLDGLQGAFGLPTVRMVFDENMDGAKGGGAASDYEPALTALVGRAHVMGELLDSFYVADYSREELSARACEYRALLGHLVDIWEVGNEINGEWLAKGVVDKLEAVLDRFAADEAEFGQLCPGWSIRPDERPFELALTLYYNGPYNGGEASSDNCWEDAEHAMLRWAQQVFGQGGALASRVSDLQFVLVSYYEDDCEGIQPDWPTVFDELAGLFPSAWLGFGECGTQSAALKASYAERYYMGMDSSDPAHANMHITQTNYIGGFFWWYFSEDMDDDAFYGVLQQALSSPFWQAR